MAESRLGAGHMARVAQLGCSIGNTRCAGRCTVHHLQGGKSLSQKASDFETIPLCEAHHLRGPYSVEGMGIRAWERMHGKQKMWLDITRLKLAVTFPEYCELTGVRK